MKKFAVALGGMVTALAIALSGASAQAGGLKDSPRAFSWTGFYVGASAGLATGQTSADLGLGGLFNTDYDMNGAIYGGQVGYNWQKGSLVLGVEGSYSATSLQGDTACLVVLECKRKVDSVATAVARVGYASDRSLLYVMGGAAWGEVKSETSIAGFTFLTDKQDHVGWTAGVGLEHALSRNLSVKIEYSHIDLGKEEHFGFADVDAKMDTFRIGANIKFN